MAAKAFDEMNSGTDGSVRAPYRGVADWLARTSPERLEATRKEVDLFYRRHGITFGAYGAAEGSETTIPFDIIPRVIAHDEWQFLHKGLSQRVQRDPARKAAGNACAHIGQMRASRQTDGSIPVV